jgi:predicted HTH transcriptional regulator
MALDEAALLRHLHSTETTFVERKRVSDTQDFTKTVVAFANTLRPDEEGVLLIGATDRGEIEDHNSNYDEMQKSFIKRTNDIYPERPNYYTVEVREGER